MTNPTAILIDNIHIPWNAIIILLSVLAWFFCARSFYYVSGYHRLAMWVLLPFALAFSLFFSRAIYWYCHQSQFTGFMSAVTSPDINAFTILGIIPGVIFSAALVRLFHLAKSLPGILDSLSPATCLGIALLYLTCFFNNSFRGKIIVEDPSRQIFPLAIITAGSGGVFEYRHPVFMMGITGWLVLFAVCTGFYFMHKKSDGVTSLFFLTVFGSFEFILESMRYDAGFFPFNGFVSIIQIFGGVSILFSTVMLSVMAIKKAGFKKILILFWSLQLAAMGATGYLEYYVQRHGNLAGRTYLLMSLSCLCMSVFPVVIFNTGRRPNKS